MQMQCLNFIGRLGGIVDKEALCFYHFYLSCLSAFFEAVYVVPI